MTSVSGATAASHSCRAALPRSAGHVRPDQPRSFGITTYSNMHGIRQIRLQPASTLCQRLLMCQHAGDFHLTVLHYQVMVDAQLDFTTNTE